MTSAQVPEALIGYLDTMDQQRRQRSATAFAALTPRERALVREAAVMGYVLAAPRGEQIPRDAEIVHHVITACLSMPDLYPTLGGSQ